jgi:hypothetical protein
VADDIQLAARDGLIAPVEDPVREAELFWMVIHGMVSMLIAKPDFPFGPPEEVYASMFQLVYRGLAPAPD